MGNSFSQEEERRRRRGDDSGQSSASSSSHHHHQYQDSISQSQSPRQPSSQFSSVCGTPFEGLPPLSGRKDTATTSVSKESVVGTSRRTSLTSDHEGGGTGSNFATSTGSVTTASSLSSRHMRTSSGSKAPADTADLQQPYPPPPQPYFPASDDQTTGATTNSGPEGKPAPSHVSSSAPERPSYARQKSTLLLDEPAETEFDEEGAASGIRKLSISEDLQPFSRAGSGEEIDLMGATGESEGPKIDQKLIWKEGGHKVYVTGSFTGWRRMIKLSWDDTNEEFSVVLKLSLGTHRMRFVVDGEMRCSNNLPTATDSMGNLVNYLEVGIEDYTRQYGGELGDMSLDEEGRYERYRDDEEAEKLRKPNYEYGNEIPPVFCDPEVMDKFAASEFVAPPQLPPHLESVILNSNATEKDNNSVLPIPNHVVLNHLATTSIKHNVLAVASISRYSRKCVAQILYAPL